MNMAQQPQGASRFTGIGIVILVHALMFAGLSSGLVQKAFKKEPTLTKARVIEPDETPQPPPPSRKPMEDPTRNFVLQQPDLIQPPQVDVVTPTEAPPGIAHDNSLPTGPSSGSGPTAQPAHVAPTVAGPVSPDLVCTRMGKPELPSVNWAGDALFRVQATVRAGRVTGTEFTVLAGTMDPKTRRALQAAIANTLRDTYECPGEHRFEQEFKVRIE